MVSGKERFTGKNELRSLVGRAHMPEVLSANKEASRKKALQTVTVVLSTPQENRGSAVLGGPAKNLETQPKQTTATLKDRL